MLNIAVLTGRRPGRLNDVVARWVVDVAGPRADVNVSLVDVGAYGLSWPEAGGAPRGDADVLRRAWSRTVESIDGFVFVTAEYNAGVASMLRGAIEALPHEWRNKAAGFVGYGAQGGQGAIEDLREALAVAGVATVAPRVALTLVPTLASGSSFVPDPRHATELEAMFEQLLSWAGALKAVRIAMRRRPWPAFAAPER